jgi:hypothetical protein
MTPKHSIYLEKIKRDDIITIMIFVNLSEDSESENEIKN